MSQTVFFTQHKNKYLNLRLMILTIILIVFQSIFCGNFLLAQNSFYSSVTAEPEVVFGDVKAFHLNNNPIDKNHYKDSNLKEKNKAQNLTYDFRIFQAEKESLSDMYRVNSGLVFIEKPAFKALGLTLLKGESNSVFQNEFDILISERLSKKIFGALDPINKIMIMDDQYAVLIKGVFTGTSLPVEVDFIAGKPTYHKMNTYRN